MIPMTVQHGTWASPPAFPTALCFGPAIMGGSRPLCPVLYFHCRLQPQAMIQGNARFECYRSSYIHSSSVLSSVARMGVQVGNEARRFREVGLSYLLISDCVELVDAPSLT
jgi:hypothetical protein